jgi:hypothetical protein
MSDFPKYPIDYVSMTTPFEDEDLERIVTQPVKDLVYTIDVLKEREVNATKAYQGLKDKIEAQIVRLKEVRQNMVEEEFPAVASVLEDEIRMLDNLL